MQVPNWLCRSSYRYRFLPWCLRIRMSKMWKSGAQEDSGSGVLSGSAEGRFEEGDKGMVSILPHVLFRDNRFSPAVHDSVPPPWLPSQQAGPSHCQERLASVIRKNGVSSRKAREGSTHNNPLPSVFRWHYFCVILIAILN